MRAEWRDRRVVQVNALWAFLQIKKLPLDFWFLFSKIEHNQPAENGFEIEEILVRRKQASRVWLCIQLTVNKPFDISSHKLAYSCIFDIQI